MEEVTVKEGFDKFKPERSVFVISGADKPNGMIAAWCTKCSSEPPMVLVSISKKGNTQNLIRESKEFVVAAANKGIKDDLMFFGTNHGDTVDKFKETEIETFSGKHVKSPLIKNATVNFECNLRKEVDCGDHFIFIGEVVAAHINQDKGILFNTKKVDGKRVFEEF